MPKLTSTQAIDYDLEFDRKKSLTKEQFLKLRPGTWVEIKWRDAPNEIALLLEKPIREPGDMNIRLFYPRRGQADTHALHSQVLREIGQLQIPTVP